MQWQINLWPQGPPHYASNWFNWEAALGPTHSLWLLFGYFLAKKNSVWVLECVGALLAIKLINFRTGLNFQLNVDYKGAPLLPSQTLLLWLKLVCRFISWHKNSRIIGVYLADTRTKQATTSDWLMATKLRTVWGRAGGRGGEEGRAHIITIIGGTGNIISSQQRPSISLFAA